MTVALLAVVVSLVVAQSKRSAPPRPALSRGVARNLPARPQMAHTGVGLSTKLPSWVMHRQLNARLRSLAASWHPKGTRSRVAGDNNVVRQTILLTRADDAATNFTFVGSTAQDLHPTYTAGETFIYFDSDRVGIDANGVDNTTENATQTFNIFRSSADGTGVQQVTTDSGQHLEPAVDSGNNNVAYVAGGSFTTAPDPTGVTAPATTGFNLFITTYTIGGTIRPLTPNTQYTFDDVRRPAFSPGGTDIAFAARRNGEANYHIYTVNVTSGVITQYTSGASNDYSPAWSPSVRNSSVIAFTSNAASFSTAGAPVVGAAPKPTDDIWVIQQSATRPGPRRVTNYAAPGTGAAATNRNPAWTTSTTPDPRTNGVQPNPAQPGIARIMLAFASSRAIAPATDPATGQPYAYPNTLSANGSTDIYMLDAPIGQDPTNSAVTTVLQTEIPFAAPPAGSPAGTVGTYTGARKLQTTNPQADLDASDKPNANIAAFDPNNTSVEDFPTFPQFLTTYRVAFQSNRGNNFNIWAASVLDIDAPELLEYNAGNNEIVRVEHLDGTDLSTGRYVDAGSTVRFKVRAVDYQSGVKYVYLQIKCPDSQPQSDDSLEHKIFYEGFGQFSATQVLDRSAYEWDAQAIKASDTQTGPKFRGTVNGNNSPNAPPNVTPVFNGPEFNWYTPGVEDFNAYSGNASPPDDINAPGATSNKDGNAGFWLQLAQDPVNRDTYTSTWQTPIGFHSDMIIDVIVYDNAVYPFDPTGGTASNWKIYDNIWGFTTRAFAANSQALYVSDYDTGQKFLNNRFGLSDFTSSTQVTNVLTGVQNRVGLTFEGNPTESWMTEFDAGLFPTATFNPASPATPPNQLVHFETPLGVNSYGSSGQDPLVGVGANGAPITGQYDIWRIQCRGPIPTPILNLYGPRTTQQPPDILGGGTSLRTQLVSDRCVIWHAPYAGDLFVGPGTILDPNTQGQLTDFVARGGRLFMSGQDVAFGLNLGASPTGNAFLNNVLRASYVSDRAIAGGAANDVINAGNSPAVRGQAPIAFETYFLPALHQDFADPTKPGIDNPPLSAPPLYIGPTTFPIINRSFGCPNQGYDLQNVVPVGFPNQVTFNPPATAGGTATFAPGVYGVDGTYVNGSPAIMWSRNAQNGRVVFSPFGWESINPDVVAIPMTTPTVYYLLNRRTELMHNVLDYLRTGRIVGTVRVRNSSGSVTGVAANTFVRAQAIDPVTLNLITFGTAYTDNNGQYRIEGLDPLGVYTLDASKPGFTTQHAQGIIFHGGYQAQSDQYIVQAQPAGLSGNVSTLIGNQPVSQAIVQAVDVTDRTLAVKPTFFSNPTDTNGNYTFNQLPASASGTTYDLSVVQSSITPLYTGSVALNPFPGLPNLTPPVPANPAISEIKVVAGQTLTPGTLTNFKVTQPNGTVTGIVVVADATTGAATTTPIPGATVNASLVTDGTNAVAGTAQTGTDGTFSLSLGASSYNLIASAPGFSTSAFVVVSVTSGQTQSSPRIVIALKPLPPGAVSGLVTTSPPLSTPVGGATVTITDSTGKTLTATTTSVKTATLTDGSTYTYNYVVTGVNAGSTVQVTATKSGYTPIPNPDTQTVTVPSLTGTDPIQGGVRSVNFILDALHTFSNSLSLVSAPYQFPVTVSDLFGIPSADINSAFSFVGWNAATQQYVFYPNPPADGFHLGQGYFLQETNTAVSLALTNPNPVSAPQDATGNFLPFSIQLSPGWNLIGDPYTSPLDLSKLQIQDAGALIDVPTAQSGSNPALGAALYTYENGSYEIVYTIDPYRGYWIRAFRPVTLIITSGAQQNRGTRALIKRTPLEIQSSEGWKLGLAAMTGDGKTQTGSKAYFGVSTKATDGYDIYKMPAPPAMGKQAVQIAFNHKDWGDKAAGYMADIRSTANTAWEFTVTSSVPNAPVTLTWPGMASLSRRVDMQMVDLDTQQTFSLRSRSSIVIPNTGALLTKRYRIEKKAASHNANLQLTNLSVTPSGTSRAAGGGSTPVGISYNLSAEATVQVSILQGGRRIRLVHSATRAAGANQASWDLKTDTGSTVATNVYTVEVRAINPTTGRAVRMVQNVLVTR